MKFLVEATNTKDVTPFLDAEAKRAAELRAAGTLTSLWLKADYSGAFLLLECADEAAAHAALGSLPLVVNDATRYALTAVIDDPR